MREEIPSVTLCFICAQPLVQGETRKLCIGKGKYQYVCTGCVSRGQDPGIEKMYQDGETE